MTKRAAIYVRVSTDKQTIENQLRELHRIAERRGWEIVQEYRDAGISGAKGRWSAIYLNWKTSEQRTSKALHDQCGLGRHCDRVSLRAALKHYMRPVQPNSSDEKKNAKSCCDAGPEQGVAKAKLFCCPVKQALASLG